MSAPASWVGVDLDGTLAEYHGYVAGEIGEPVPAILALVKDLLLSGRNVRIFTARATDESQLPAIREWCVRHIGTQLPITCIKDLGMVCLLDDRAVAVEPNKGNMLGWRDPFGAPPETLPPEAYPRERHPLSERFHAELRKLGELHDLKSEDYGMADDPFANVRAGADWGTQDWVAAMIRATDKVRRLQTYAARGTLSNESARDAFMDLAVYSIIAMILHEEGQEA